MQNQIVFMELRFTIYQQNADYKLLQIQVNQNLNVIPCALLVRVKDISVRTKGSAYRQKYRYGYSGEVVALHIILCIGLFTLKLDVLQCIIHFFSCLNDYIRHTYIVLLTNIETSTHKATYCF